MSRSKCAICGSKKPRFIKKQARGKLSSLVLNPQLSNIPLFGDILFLI